MAAEAQDGGVYIDGKELRHGDEIEWLDASGAWVLDRALVTVHEGTTEVSTVIEEGSVGTVLTLELSRIRWPQPRPPYVVG